MVEVREGVRGVMAEVRVCDGGGQGGSEGCDGRGWSV